MPSGIVKRGLYALYDFTDPAGSQVLTDKSGRGYNGQNGSDAGADTNDVTFDGSKGVFGEDDYISLTAKDTNLSRFKKYTIVCAYVTAKMDGYLWSNGNSALDRNGMQVQSNILRFGYYNGTSYIGASGSVVQNIPYVATGICDEGQIKLFINNILQTGTKAISSGATATQDWGRQANVPEYFTGNIYMGLIYNTTLRPAEVRQNYKAIQNILAVRGVSI